MVNWVSATPKGLVRARRIRVAREVAQRAIDKLNPDTLNVKFMRREQVVLGKERRHDGTGASNAELATAKKHLLATRKEVGDNTSLGYYQRGAIKTQARSLRNPYLTGLVNQIHEEKDIIKKKQGAQCGELSRYVFYRLVKMGETPCHSCFADRVNIWGAKPGSATFEKDLDNHAFTVIGLDHPARIQDMRNWPDTVIICDPWVMMLARDTRDGQGANPGAYTPAEYLRIGKPYFLNGGKIEVHYGVD
jgi:hypothetical protein